ncbi:nuclear transport factor 2 family protein [Thermus sp. SYSU G05001]|uniref:Nuclear transport factor 2 family protein n=1 Tax=Thermus brevis TaxID=2862456 RepID=A0ABS6ZX51_9DEIN|nr:nuclear transport factor 2 family protein [Thermus brevis]MBW6394463.1 nuclear transport factor 2 family protein [Thermus brevis]
MKGKFEKITGKSFDNPDETRRPFEKGKIDVITVGGLPFYRETLAPGWQWSKHVKPVVGGNSCQRFHVKIFLAGRQRVRMDDGTEMEFGPGDVAVMHPGHDAWVVGDEANVLIELADIVKMPADVPEETLTKITLEAVRRFNEAINRHDVDAVMAAMTEDCVFENTYPPPDGARYEGQAAVRSVWERFFVANPDAHFEVEEMFAVADRCVVRWIYRKTKEGRPWYLRGVDVFRVRDGKVAEKFSYVKG